MNFHVLTLFPEMIMQGVNTSITGRAIKQNIISVEAVDIRDFSQDKHRRVDDYTYGGGAGMLMQPQPVYDAWKSVANRCNGTTKKLRTIYVTPQGHTFNQRMAEEFAKEEELVILCGHYEGVDERVLEEIVTDYISIGDYVLTGGELAAMVMVDAIARLVPEVLGNEVSAETESFQNHLLEYPQYTRPEVWHDKQVPQVLLGGNPKEVNAWRLEAAIARTRERRPDLYEEYAALDSCRKLLLKDKLKHIDMIELINRGRAELCYRVGNEILIQDRVSGVYFHTNLDEEFLAKLRGRAEAPDAFAVGLDCAQQTASLASGDQSIDWSPYFLREMDDEEVRGIDCIVLHQEVLAETVGKRLGLEKIYPCYQEVCTRREKLSVSGLYRPDGRPMPNGLTIRPIGTEYEELILQEYHSLDDPEYVQRRIRQGALVGAFVGEKLAGFIGTHSEGSVGMLTVLPEYRRMHIGMALETYMLNREIEQGHIPYAQVLADNEVSERLQRKMGLYRAKERIVWVE